MEDPPLYVFASVLFFSRCVLRTCATGGGAPGQTRRGAAAPGQGGRALRAPPMTFAVLIGRDSGPLRGWQVQEPRSPYGGGVLALLPARQSPRRRPGSGSWGKSNRDDGMALKAPEQMPLLLY